jgi:hypothetical protein
MTPHKGRPDIMLAFGSKPKEADDEPSPDSEGGEDNYGSDAEDQACSELADILGVPEDKHEDFKSALDAFFEAKMSK